jgi:hypothetical protein
LPARKFIDSQYGEKDSTQNLLKDLKTIQSLSNNKRILIIFDEIENITYGVSPTKHWADGEDFLMFWQTIRSIFQSTEGLFSFIIAGVNPKIIDNPSVGGHDNPVFKIASHNYLSLFSLGTVKEMVEQIGGYMGLRFDEEVSFLLHEDFGGHPFLTRIACSSINKHLKSAVRPFKVTKFNYLENRKTFCREAKNYVEQLLSVLKTFYPDEYEMLEFLAKGNRTRFKEYISKSATFLEHLAGYGIINIDNDEYYFKIKIIEEYLKESGIDLSSFDTKEKRWSEINLLRNTLETKLRSLAVIVLIAFHGEKKAMEHVLNALPRERRKKITIIDIESLLEKHYTLFDLIQLYKREMNLFQKIFDNNPERFIATLNHINSCRADAHAKSIDDYNLSLLITEFRWLEQCLNKTPIK